VQKCDTYEKSKGIHNSEQIMMLMKKDGGLEDCTPASFLHSVTFAVDCTKDNPRHRASIGAIEHKMTHTSLLANTLIANECLLYYAVVKASIQSTCSDPKAYKGQKRTSIINIAML
jgi:hypothetical protein